MSAVILRNNENVHGTTFGNSKPLHRFIKGQPKILGIVVLVLGSSFFIVSVGNYPDDTFWTISHFLVMGVLFMICGILYILTEHNTTKKTVTTSLALSIVTTIGAFYSVFPLSSNISYFLYAMDRDYDFIDEHHNVTEINEHQLGSHGVIALSLELIFMFYLIIGVIIFITMSCLAVSALRSTKSQAIVVMTATPAETPGGSEVQ